MVEVEVEFDYDAELKDELTIRTGDVITNVKQMDGGWWEGSIKGKRGLFPDNFVKVISNGSPMKKKEEVVLRKGENKRKHCKVLFSYQPTHEDELELNINDVIEYTEEVEDGWWKGVNKAGRIGVFPSNFVQIMDLKKNDEIIPPTTVADKNKKNKEKITKSPNNEGTSSVVVVVPTSAKVIEKKPMPPTSLNVASSNNEESKIQSSSESLNAPKLPPKPVKETCRVIFPYKALNDDELQLNEGQTLNIISKDVEDKGWWKGELDGKIGVFPDNFVKLITVDDANPPPLKKLSNTTKPVFKRDNSTDKNAKKVGGSTSKLNSSFGKSTPPPPTTKSSSFNNELKKAESLTKVASGRSASPLKNSFGKSSNKTSSNESVKNAKTESPMRSRDSLRAKAKDPPPSIPKMKESPKQTKESSKPTKESPKSTKESPKQNKESPKLITKEKASSSSLSPPPKDFDHVIRRESLNHPTADRVKGPKRRPPSSVFLKDASSTKSPDTSLSSSNENLSSLPPVTASKSSKIVQNIKGVLGGLSNGTGDKKSSTEKNVKKVDVEKRPASFSTTSTDPILSSPTRHSLTKTNDTEDTGNSKKPEWLEELSRKQAHRKSGLFQEKSSSDLNNKSSPPSEKPTAVVTATEKPTPPGDKPSIIGEKPIIHNDTKPYIPTKPSQIRDEARKFVKRPTSIESLGGGSDKENNKPVILTSPNKEPTSSIETKPPKPTTVVLESAKTNNTSSSIIPSASSSHQNSPINESKDKFNLDIDLDNVENLSLLERVRKLERNLLDVHAFYGKKIQELTTCLEKEHNTNVKLQSEIQALKKYH